MKRRAAIVAAAMTIAAGVGTTPALAGPGDGAVVRTTAADTNGCVVVKPLLLAVCVPRL